jgi:glycosyltransferase involved in cell wall biosynthesis
MKKIWIDPHLLENKSGIGRDARFMLGWLNSNFECEIVRWPSVPFRNAKSPSWFLLGMRIVFGKIFHLPNTYDGAFYQSQLGPLLPGKGIRLWIVRLHDLFPQTNPEWFRWWSTRIFKRSLQLAVERHAIFLCDSSTTKIEMDKLFPGEILNTFVVPCQLPEVSPAKCGFCGACQNVQVIESGDYFLSVGTVEPRKNYLFALSAWNDFAEKKQNIAKLIIVGRPGWKTSKLQKDLEQSKDVGVIWFSQTCDGALEELYKGSKALISFSLAEGFDLPPMEARQRFQKPLVLSDIPVHREFHDGSAKFFSDNLELLKILKDPLVASSYSNYSDFSLETLNETTSRVRSML